MLNYVIENIGNCSGHRIPCSECPYYIGGEREKSLKYCSLVYENSKIKGAKRELEMLENLDSILKKE